MNENMLREMIKKISVIIGAISIVFFVLSFLVISAFPFGTRSESALLAVGAILIYAEIEFLNVASKTYKKTLLFYLIVSLLLRFVREVQLLISPFILWGHIVFCILCFIWIAREPKKDNI